MEEDAINTEININIINWHCEDVNFSKFVIYGFGKNINGENCTICITDYKPEMYIRLRINSSDNKEKNKLMNELKEDKYTYNKLLNSIDYICS